MTKISKQTALVLGVLAASIAAPSVASAQCWSQYATKVRSTEHKARQAAILAVNYKFNALKAAAIPAHVNAQNLNAWIAANRKILPIKLYCFRVGANYKCKARKSICTK